MGLEPGGPEEVALVEERRVPDRREPRHEPVEPVEQPLAHEDREVDDPLPHGRRI